MDVMESVSVMEPESRVASPILVADEPAPRRGRLRRLAGWLFRGLGSSAEYAFGLASLVVGLSVLAALPLAQLLSLGYFLESAARVARSGRLRDGLIGVRRAARVGGLAVGTMISLVPLWLVSSYAQTAELIEPGGSAARGWRLALAVTGVLTFIQILTACARGGRIRHFLWPVGTPFWLVNGLKTGGLYAGARDGFWNFVAALQLPYLFRLGLVGFLGTMAWLFIPATLIAASGQYPLLGFIGAFLLAFVASSLPFLQVRYAVEGRISALFSLGSVRERFRRAPWAFAFSLMVLLLAAVPLYLLKIEMIPREAAWLPSVVFVIFLAPAHVLVGWAYARSWRRYRPRHWFVRALGRLAILPVALFYVLVVVLAQYTSWLGIWSVYEQHAFLLPVPFLSMN
jgi:hypothetical protein